MSCKRKSCPYETAVLPLTDYWSHAQYQVAQALAKTGVLPVPVAPHRTLTDLFSQLAPYPPIPLQQRADTLPLGREPQLLILENVTGAGKTEAAMLLAHRLMQAGSSDGLYVGLPTMATANAMYEQLAGVGERLFADGARPSLVLAHSAHHLSARFRQAVLPAQPVLETDYQLEGQTATTRCAAWLADSRKKALLATLGIGTLDQARQAILQCKHQSLRLLGLFGKVLIADEVHACDTYMYTLLQQVLTFHRAMGGSAILLSATLPQRMREELVAAFRRGSGQPPALVESHYPLLTQIDGPTAVEYPLATRPAVKRQVHVRWLADPAAVEATILAAQQQGRCVCWTRNTVKDALAAYNALAGRIAADRLVLFHARFTLGDRLRIEQEMLTRFGPASNAAQCNGWIVIATQVVEQSLDVDFDLLISVLHTGLGCATSSPRNK